MSEAAKSARKAMKSKIARLVSTDPHQKVDASSWTPPEPLDADVKTGMRPISRRQFKRGGKVLQVSGEDAKHRADRSKRSRGGENSAKSEEFMNRNYKEANEERSGKKHIGGMNKGGTAKRAGGGFNDFSSGPTMTGGSNDHPYLDLVKTLGTAYINAQGQKNRYRNRDEKNSSPLAIAGKKRGGTAKRAGGAARDDDRSMENLTPSQRAAAAEMAAAADRQNAQAMATAAAAARRAADSARDRGDYGSSPTRAAPAANSRTGMPAKTGDMRDAEYGDYIIARAKGGKAKWEGSKKDESQDKKLAKKYGMSMDEWEKSGLDDKHDSQKSMKGLKKGGLAGKAGGGGLEVLSPAAMLAMDPKKAKYLSPIAMAMGKKSGGSAHAKDCTCKACGGSLDGELQGTRPTGGRLARKSGGRAKGRTNINIIIGTGHKDHQEAPGGLAPMPRPPSQLIPPSGPPGMPPGGPPMPPPMPSGGPPPMGAPGMGPPPGGPMMRKSGGRVGNRRYYSASDMDAGAGSGLGRLEKTEIQKHQR
tara:strand:- start:4474 stop:6069 length:1596 start_codon:yes stop_codon:yes gene_type:complete